MNASSVRTTTHAIGLLALSAAVLVGTFAADATGAGRGAGPRHPQSVAATSPRAAASVGLAAWLRSLRTNRRQVLQELVSPALRSTATAARANETPCGQTPGLLCSQVEVPLDSTGAFSGTVSLHVERLPALGVPKGVMFLIAGGPGQGSAHSFDLGTPDNALFQRYLFPGYTLVTYDDRGTGASGLLRCPSLESSYPVEAEAAAAASCAEAIGQARDFYGTLDHAADLDAVRASLGVDKIGLYGVSYGTKLALAYTLVYGSHVERLLLNSVLRTDQPDPFGANTLQAMPATLTAFCSTAPCNAADPNLASDVAALANQLAAKPVTGNVLQPDGSTRTQRVGGSDLLSLVVDADLNPGLAVLLPGAVREARLGDLRPLLRLQQLDSASSAEAPQDLSSALYAATDCHDGPFPWPPNASLADRQAAYQSAIAALPPGSLGPFGSWAAVFGTAHFCLQWPSPTGGVTYGNGTVPDVPMLVISGGFDMRTPTASANPVVALFPQGRLLLVPGVGHDAVDADPSFCAADNVRAWMTGGAVAAQCPRGNPFVSIVPRFPAVRSTTLQRQNASQTLALATKTLREAEAIWFMTNGGVAGLYSGKLVATSSRTFKLVRYSVAPGVELTGNVRFVKFGPPLSFDGTVSVGGAAATRGVLGFSGNRIGGTLDGQIVGR